MVVLDRGPLDFFPMPLATKVDGNHQYKLDKFGRKKHKFNPVAYRQKKPTNI